MGLTVDLNADLGESFGRWSLGNDAALMPHITFANIACGWHGIDLSYSGAGELLLERAVLPKEPEAMGRVAVRLIKEGGIAADDGTELEFAVDTICIHGDAPNAPEVAESVGAALREAGVEVAALGRAEAVRQ